MILSPECPACYLRRRERSVATAGGEWPRWERFELKLAETCACGARTFWSTGRRLPPSSVLAKPRS